MKQALKKWNDLNLVIRIVIGLVIGIILALITPSEVAVISLLGTLFVSALKAVAPVLVLFIVAAAICQHQAGTKTNMKTVIVLYLVGTTAAGVIAVAASFIFKLNITLADASAVDITPPGGLGEVLNNIVMNIFCNPIDALLNGNYLGILTWAILLGIALRFAKPATKEMVGDVAKAIEKIIYWVINLAPLGVLGIVYGIVATNGLAALSSYGEIIILLVGVMLVDALVINPIIVFLTIHKNPYPLVLKCLARSGITAFFTRSSAANIPVNMELCEEMGLDEETFSVSIPLGATINMGGASITIAVMSLATAFTLGIDVDFGSAVILILVAAASACGASGVPGGSLLLIPLACSLFGIPIDIAMQTAAVGYIIGVVQDSCETAINSSTDVLFTASADIRAKQKAGK
ncbi:MAG: serine/threonine transporter SstT [Clostridia bacterium]|nr:serine/threonine transporter SstT [Clostridia bacterium]